MKKLVLIALAWLALSLSAYAGPVSMVFIGFQPGGWQVGYPYYVTINGGPAADLMCDDWVHGGLPGDMWQANATNLATADLTYLRFNTLPNALTLYDEAGWLLLQTTVTPYSQWMDINYAVWHIFDSSVTLSPNAQAWLTNAQQEAQNGFPGVNFARVEIYTPINQYDPNPNNPQEFLQVVPEPGTMMLLLTGLAGAITRKLLA